MKRIKITNANIDKIEAAIKEAEGRSNVRTINAKDAFEALSDIENHFALPMKKMVGIRVSVDVNAQDFPRAYKYTPKSTQFVVERCSNGWYLTYIERDTVKAPSRKYVLCDPLTEEQKKAILNRYASWS